MYTEDANDFLASIALIVTSSLYHNMHFQCNLARSDFLLYFIPGTSAPTPVANLFPINPNKRQVHNNERRELARG